MIKIKYLKEEMVGSMPTLFSVAGAISFGCENAKNQGPVGTSEGHDETLAG